MTKSEIELVIIALGGLLAGDDSSKAEQDRAYQLRIKLDAYRQTVRRPRTNTEAKG